MFASLKGATAALPLRIVVAAGAAVFSPLPQEGGGAVRRRRIGASWKKGSEGSKGSKGSEGSEGSEGKVSPYGR